MIDNVALSEEVYANPRWNTQRVLVSVKQAAGKLYVDCRKWTEKNGTLAPSKGIMLALEDWTGVIPLIQRAVESANTTKNK